MTDFDLGAVGEIVQAIEELPPLLRLELAYGPLPDPECRICRTLRIDEDWHARGGVAGEAVLDFHAVGSGMLLAATTGTIGTTQRPTNDELGEARRVLERRAGHPYAWVAVDSLADQLAFMRALFVYQVAGWRP